MPTTTKTRARKRPEKPTASRRCAEATGSGFLPHELMPAPDLGDDCISELKRVEIEDGKGSHDGISFMVDLPPGCCGTEICLTNGQLKQLLDFGRWKRVPRKLDTPNDQDETRGQ